MGEHLTTRHLIIILGECKYKLSKGTKLNSISLEIIVKPPIMTGLFNLLDNAGSKLESLIINYQKYKHENMMEFE